MINVGKALSMIFETDIDVVFLYYKLFDGIRNGPYDTITREDYEYYKKADYNVCGRTVSEFRNHVSVVGGKKKAVGLTFI